MSSSRHRSRRPAAFRPIEQLEQRQLLSVTALSDLASQEQVTATIPTVTASVPSPASNDITLSSYFTDPAVPGTVVSFNTTAGSVVVALTDQATPLTVANFLSYVNSGAYNGSFFHRSAIFTNSNAISSSNPADIIQGGGYTLTNNTINDIPSTGTVNDEYTTATFGDLQGTIAAAKTSSANSASSEWYFNVHDNSSALDTPTTDSSGATTSYTAFGHILSGMSSVNIIASLPTDQITSDLTEVPVSGLTQAQITAGNAVTADNLVYTNSVTSEAGTTYAVSSDNTALVEPTVTNGVLSFSYPNGGLTPGSANVTVTATNYDGTTAATTFAVDVPQTPSVVIGAGSKYKSLTYTQTDGSIGHLRVNNAAATVVFDNDAAVVKTHNGVATATGGNIADLVLENHGRAPATVSLTGKAALTVGLIYDAGPVFSITAPTTTFTGETNLAGLDRLNIAGLNGATFNVGSEYATPTFIIPTAVNSSLNAGNINSLQSKSWTVTDGAAHAISAGAINKLNVSGSFADELSLSNTANYELTSATVAHPSAAWTLAGAVNRLTVVSPTSGWAVNSSSGLINVSVRGDLLGAITAVAVVNLKVSGNITGATVTMDAPYNKKGVALAHVKVGGAITNSTITTLGNLGTVSAASMSGSRITTGVTSTDSLPTDTSGLSSDANIGSVSLAGKTATFATSQIAAYRIGALRLGTIAVVANGPVVGVAAHTFSSIHATLSPGGPLVLGPAQLKSAAVLAAYFSTKSIDVENLTITVLPTASS